RHGRERAIGRVAVAALASQGGETKQDEGRHRRPGRRRVVLRVLRPRDEYLVVVGGVEEAAGRVREVVEDRVGQLPCGDEPAVVERRLVEREQALGEVRVVLENAIAG